MSAIRSGLTRSSRACTASQAEPAWASPPRPAQQRPLQRLRGGRRRRRRARPPWPVQPDRGRRSEEVPVRRRSAGVHVETSRLIGACNTRWQQRRADDALETPPQQFRERSISLRRQRQHFTPPHPPVEMRQNGQSYRREPTPTAPRPNQCAGPGPDRTRHRPGRHLQHPPWSSHCAPLPALYVAITIRTIAAWRSQPGGGPKSQVSTMAAGRGSVTGRPPPSPASDSSVCAPRGRAGRRANERHARGIPRSRPVTGDMARDG
jgi:hypothetical protein